MLELVKHMWKATNFFVVLQWYRGIHIFPKANVTSNKNVHSFWHHFHAISQFVIDFDQRVSALNNI